MYKRFLGILLCLTLLAGAVLPVYAQESEDAPAELRIGSEAEFLTFAENCRMDAYSQNLSVILESDLDLGGMEFAGIPIFCGTFDGGGHRISGIDLRPEGSDQGLFRYLTATAVVRDLEVSGDVQPGGSRVGVGGIAGSNAGYILNCRFSGTVCGGDRVGGLAGVNAVTGILENCVTEGDISGSHFVGGIAGENYGVIRGCENYAGIDTTARQNTVKLTDVTMDTLTASESANTATDIGGIAGISSGVIRDCENRGDVGYRQMGYNIGGIAGTQSGYIAGCRNYGKIQGRKEVGGIVGQMEPASVISYSADTLQILQGQLGTMSALVDNAAGNARSNASQITGQIGVLRDQAQTAREAVETLFPSEENPHLPDLDTILAAQNTLTTTISAMPGTLDSIAGAAQTTVSGLTGDLQTISGQLDAISATVSSASEHLGGSLTDISDADTPELLTGKVEDCANSGGVLADRNVGGIAGAMAVENDLDILEDWEEYGRNSLNFAGEVRAVVLRCRNTGTVACKKQNAGGIVGWQSLGLVKDCVNTGDLDAPDADYVGGVSGTGSGFIRACSARCAVSGSTYVGGIAGSAAVVTDCRSVTAIRGGSEKRGAVLGGMEDGGETETPVSGNYYMPVAEDPGAIDGISYAGLAQPLEMEPFLELEDLPELFQRVTVRFVYADGTQKQFLLAPGGALDAADVPAVPEKEGYTGRWEGLEGADLTYIPFDLTFRAVYTPYRTVIQSGETGENGLPLLLAQGAFADDAEVTVSASRQTPATEKGESPVAVWDVCLRGSTQITAGRLLAPEGLEAERTKLLVRGADGVWKETAFTADESYLVFPMDGSETQLAVLRLTPFPWQWVAAGCGAAAAALAAGIGIVCRKKRGKRADTQKTGA